LACQRRAFPALPEIMIITWEFLVPLLQLELGHIGALHNSDKILEMESIKDTEY